MPKIIQVEIFSDGELLALDDNGNLYRRHLKMGPDQSRQFVWTQFDGPSLGEAPLEQQLTAMKNQAVRFQQCLYDVAENLRRDVWTSWHDEGVQHAATQMSRAMQNAIADLEGFK